MPCTNRFGLRVGVASVEAGRVSDCSSLATTVGAGSSMMESTGPGSECSVGADLVCEGISMGTRVYLGRYSQWRPIQKLLEFLWAEGAVDQPLWHPSRGIVGVDLELSAEISNRQPHTEHEHHLGEPGCWGKVQELEGGTKTGTAMKLAREVAISIVP
jgi:hypothetical protein